MTWQTSLVVLIIACCYIGLSVSSPMLQVDQDDTSVGSYAGPDTLKEVIPDEVVVPYEMDDRVDANVIDINKEFSETGEDAADSEVLHSSQSEADSSSRLSGQETKLTRAAFASDGTVYITKAKDCKALYEIGIYQSGVYQLHIEDPDNPRPLTPQVYCELSDSDIDGGGWTYIQSRVDDSVDFYRYWDEYERGFGDPTGNYWAGLNVIHQLTQKSTELMVYLETFSEGSGYAHYDQFSVGDTMTNYTLSIGTFSGTAGHSLINNRMFSTRGRDNDMDETRSCAEDEAIKGGWWYSSCGYSNLNGVYYPESYTGNNRGIYWYEYRQSWTSPRFSHVSMKIRRM